MTVSPKQIRQILANYYWHFKIILHCSVGKGQNLIPFPEFMTIFIADI